MKPILLDIPETLETERLLLRALRPGDGAEMNAAIIESIPQLRPWLLFAKETPTVQESEENVRQGAAQFLQRAKFNYLMWLKEKPSESTHPDGKIVGRLGIFNLEWEVPSCEIGYWMRTPYCGNGYMTEATQRVVDFAFDTLGCLRVIIRCDAKNSRSAAIPKRLGFTLEGTLKNESRDHFGMLRDTLLFAKYRPGE